MISLFTRHVFRPASAGSTRRQGASRGFPYPRIPIAALFAKTFTSPSISQSTREHRYSHYGYIGWFGMFGLYQTYVFSQGKADPNQVAHDLQSAPLAQKPSIPQHHPKPIAIRLSVTDGNSNDRERVIQEVIDLQRTLVIDHVTAQDSLFLQKRGFLTVQTTNKELRKKLADGYKVITARDRNRLVGYLILGEIDRTFQWLRDAGHVTIFSSASLDSLEKKCRDKEIKSLSQIAVDPSFTQQGIGKQLVEYAKALAPEGLVTSILYQPITNSASLAFFEKQGFSLIAIAYCQSYTAYVALWKHDWI